MDKVYAVIPTFNEEDELEICLNSLKGQLQPELVPIVANAGKPLSKSLGERCVEVPVAESCFWAASMQAGFDKAVELGADYVLMSNADIEFLPGSVSRLLEHARSSPGTIVCSPGYRRDSSGRLRLQYSRDCLVPFLLHNYLRRDWRYFEDAPDGVIETDLAGGQGVLVPARLLKEVRLDPALFPQYRADHDFWFRLRSMGISMVTVCRAGICNTRPLAGKVWGRGMDLKRLAWYVSSPYAPESVITQWRLRMKHLPLPLALISFALMCPGAWVWRLVKAGAIRTKEALRGAST